MSFAALGVSPDLCRRLSERGIDAPFPIQAATLPDALAGRDVCGKAPTGSGKTLAFGLAIAGRNIRPEPGRPQALVLVPTRELAAQVQDELYQLVDRKVGVLAIYGGVSYDPQRRALRKGVGVLVACPGRLEDLVQNGDIDLSCVELVVLDEADRMADMGFLPAVKRLLDQTSPDRQTLLFSATLDGDVDQVVKRYQHDPARHEVAPELAGDVDHHFWLVAREKRVDLAAKLLADHPRAIVFSRTKHGSDRIAKQLNAKGISAVAVHGNRSQSQRSRAVDDFTAGRFDCLVATDVAARGIHIDDVTLVLHFDPPADAKDYTHRSGRTGRAGSDGRVISLVSPDQRKAVESLKRSLGLKAETVAPIELEAPPRPPTPVAKVRVPRVADGAKQRPARPERPRRERGFERDRPARTAPTSTGGNTTGVVKFFHAGKGYGFIESDQGGEDLFVHISNIDRNTDTLEPGQRVEFEPARGQKGAEALRVIPVQGHRPREQRPTRGRPPFARTSKPKARAR